MFKLFKWKKDKKPAYTIEESSEQSLQNKEISMSQDVILKEDLGVVRTVYLFPVSRKNVGGSKWGFINNKGKLVLKPIYEHAGDFQNNGLAIVALKARYGVIDTSGYFIVNPQYEMIYPFSESRATVMDDQGFKVIDESGQELTSKAYSYIGSYTEGRALFSITDRKGNQLYGFLNRWGKEVIPGIYESATDFKEGKSVVKLKEGSYALISLTGKVLQMYNYFFVGDYGEGLLAFQKSSGDKFGYMNEQGKIIIEPKFTGTERFREGCAIVHVSDGQNEHAGMIDKTGHYIIKPNYHQIMYLGEGRVAIGKAIDPEKSYRGSLLALGDISGHILTGFIFNAIKPFRNGAASAHNDLCTFFIDKKGKRISALPIVSGTGTLQADKTLIKGEIDFRLLYFKTNGELVWEQKTVIPLHDRYAVMEEKYKPNKDFVVYYPQITGMISSKMQARVNQFLKDLAGIKETPAHLRLESNYTGDFNVTFYKKELLVIEIKGYHYPLGAAHGTPIKKYAHLNLKTGEIFTLKDLFNPIISYVKVLSERIGNQIKNRQEYQDVFPGSYKGIHLDQPFYISEKGLNLFFPPYEIAPYAAGFPTFTIPFEELTSILDISGDFWKSFH